MSSAYLRLLIFLLAILIPACASCSPVFLMMYSTCKLNKQGDSIQPWHSPFPIWNQSVVLCPVLTFASWPAVLGLGHISEKNRQKVLDFYNIYLLFFFFKIFKKCGPFKKSSLNLLQYCFCLMSWFFSPEACRILTSWPRIDPHFLHWKVKS